METTDLVERVARAIASKLGNGSPLAARLEAARAALEAAGVPALQARVERLEDLLWRAMDDASLSPGDWYAEARAFLAKLRKEQDDVATD